MERVRKAKRVLVLTHSNADVDAIAAACSIAHIAKALGSSSVEVLVPEGISIDARDCAKICSDSLGVKVSVARKGFVPNVDRVDLCVIVDTATYVQLKNLSPIVDRCCGIVVIDHHSERDRFPNVVMELIDPDASSSSELAYELSSSLGIAIPRELATLLMAGIVFDTRRFSRATPRMFKVLASLLEMGADYDKALQLAAPKQLSQKGPRVARIKCILRHKGFHVADKDIYMAISEVGAYESLCANSLISIGYDIALVFTEDDALKATRIVFRAKEDALNRASLDVYNDLLKPLVEKYGGGGGGHKLAGAAIIMHRNIEEVMKALGEVIKKRFGPKLREIAEERVSV